MVVHNGIIENYQQLKEMLQHKGKSFSSETDTEVVANLVELFYDEGSSFADAVRKAIHRIEGSYALGILCIDCPDTMIAVKKDSPLIFGYGDGEMFIASDVPAILKYTRQVSYLDDGDMAVFTAEHVDFFNALGEPVEKKIERINWELSAAEKGGYAHFMLKEIHEQPKAIRDTISPRIQNGNIVLDEVSLTAVTCASCGRFISSPAGRHLMSAIWPNISLKNTAASRQRSSWARNSATRTRSWTRIRWC